MRGISGRAKPRVLKPLADAGSARKALGFVLSEYSAPRQRAAAMAKLLARARIAERTQKNEKEISNVLSLLERAHSREVKRLKPKKGKAAGKSFVFTDNAAGSCFKAIDERIWLDIKFDNFSAVSAELRSLDSLAKKLKCFGYAGEYFEDFAEKIKKIVLFSENEQEKEWSGVLFFDALGKAREFFALAGKKQKAMLLADYARKMVKQIR